MSTLLVPVLNPVTTMLSIKQQRLGTLSKPKTLDRRNHGSKNRLLLSIGADLHLLETRELVLRSVGYQVRSVGEMMFSVDRSPVHADLVLICHSVPRSRVLPLLDRLLHTRPAKPLLLLTLYDDDVLEPRPGLYYSAPYPMELLQSVRDLLSGYNHLITGQ